MKNATLTSDIKIESVPALALMSATEVLSII
jgi:hypothetical protein